MSCLKKTTLVHEDQRLTHFAALLQKRIADAFCGGGDVIWNNVLFVDQGDPGAVPTIGYWTRKYPTIQAAVDAATEGDLIWINPGDYVENVDLSNIADKVTIQGSGLAATNIIAADTALPAVQFVPALHITPLTFLVIKDLAIYNNGEDEIALLVDMENDPGSFNNGAVILDDLIISGDTNYRMLNDVLANNINHLTAVTFLNVSHCKYLDSRFDVRTFIDYDFKEIQPSRGRDKLEFVQSNMQGITFNNTPSVFIANECVIDEQETTAMDGLLVRDAGSATVPFIECHCKIYGSVNIQYEDVAESSELIADFDNIEFNGPLFAWISSIDNGGMFQVRARNATFAGLGKDTISADGVINGGKGILGVLDIQNSTFQQDNLDSSSFGIDRTLHLLAGESINVLPTVTSLVIAPPFANVIYTIHPEVDNGAGPPPGLFVVVETANKANNGFDAVASQPANVNFRLVAQ